MQVSAIVVRGIVHIGNQILLVRNRGRNFWCLPGGKLDQGESVFDCLKREFGEELGVVPEIGKLLYIQQIYREGEGYFLPEFIFDISNSEQFEGVDFSKATHAYELDGVKFSDLSTEHDTVLPKFLKDEYSFMVENSFSFGTKFYLNS